ncbi:MAG: response regulator transcription factor [Ignavibacteria bacterium]|nr:response regulator transcription factor [Ignavibacteria bacterium]
MIKVMIADDHSVVRRGIKQILSEETDIRVLGEAENSEEIFEQLYIQDWDVLILDITMPGKRGLDALIELKLRKPDLKVLILSMHPEEEIAIRALKTGASGYLNKDSVPGELSKAIRKVYSGGKYISNSLAENIFLSMEKDENKLPHNDLSEREFQVLCLIASGNTLSQIAIELSLSIKTISTYRTRILEKMKLHTNVELTHYAIKNKLVLNT